MTGFFDHEARAAAVAAFEDGLAGDVGKVFVQGAADDGSNIARLHTGMMPRRKSLSIIQFVDNLGAHRLRRGHVGAVVACRADCLVKTITIE